MTIWFFLSLMTLGAVFAVLWPLRSRAGGMGGGEDVAVYRDQLAELERDRKAGLIGGSEAEAARVEIGRRLIRAADAQPPETTDGAAAAQEPRRGAAVAAFLLLPALAIATYGMVGSPSLPGAPLAERKPPSLEARSIETLLTQVESHLGRNPEDGRGWEVIAPVYMGLGRFEDAVRARRNALRLNGATTAREADLGEALTAAANGVVTAEAQASFERALAADAKNVKARFLLGLAAEQDGRTQEAAAAWRALLADAPADAPWVGPVRQSLARLGGSPPPAAGGPSADEAASAAELPPDAQAEMVRGMVERLATRLRADGSDAEGWVRLVRAYLVLGEPDKAKSAAADARRAVAGDPEKLRRVNDAVKAFGLES